MAKTARNKKYRPKRVHVPMLAESRNNIALEFHLAVEALIHAPCQESYNQLQRMIAALAIAGGANMERRLYLHSMAVATQAIAQRLERVGKVGLSGDEIQVLRRGVAKVDTVLAGMCMNQFKEAVARVRLACWLTENAED